MGTLEAPEFIYFDLGKVLLEFSHEKMCAQMAKRVGLEPQLVKDILFEGDLIERYEVGQLNSTQFCDAFFEKCGASCDPQELLWAGSDIFELKSEMLPLVAHLSLSGSRLGILSNTCAAHWEFAKERFSFLSDFFPLVALSFELGNVKPGESIYRQAAIKAKTEPRRIFFVDDRPENVQGAIAEGWDAHVFQSAEQTLRLLLDRGVCLNY